MQGENKLKIPTNSKTTHSMVEYYSVVYEKIQDAWKRHKFKKWDESLEALLVIEIDKNGEIIDSFFERKSKNDDFNVEVLKAVLLSKPLPKFPPDFKKEKLEIGLRFKPNKLY